MKFNIYIVLFILSLWSFSCVFGQEFGYYTSYQNDFYERINSDTEYVALVNRDYRNFSDSDDALKDLKGFLFRADKITKIGEDSISAFGKKFPAINYRLHLKTKIIGTRGIATVTYTNRNLRLKMDLIQDLNSVLKDTIEKRIKKISVDRIDKDYYAPWVIRLNERGVFKNCDTYALWDIYYEENEAYAIYWIDNKLLRIGVAPESERFSEDELRTWQGMDSISKEDYLKEIRSLDYSGMFTYSQGCSYFIGGDEGGIKWKSGDCEVLFECESNIESKEILELLKKKE